MIYSPSKTLYGNFKMYEVSKSQTATRFGIDNTPSDAVLERAEQVAIHIAQPVRDHFGPYSPNSWFRCEDLEKAITKTAFKRWIVRHGMEDRSYWDSWNMYFNRKSHPKGEAIDFEIAGTSNIDLYKWCSENLPLYDQLIAEFMKIDNPSSGWVHGSYSENNRMQLIEIK